MKLVFFATLFLLFPNAILAQDQTPENANPQQQEAADATEAVDEEINEGGNPGPEGVDIAEAAIGFDNSQMVAAKRFQLNQIFAVEIDEIKRVCDLDEKQVIKLTVGAKGAIKIITNEWGKTVGRGFGDMPAAIVDVDGNEDELNDDGQPVEETSEIEFTDADQIDEMSLQMVVMGAGGNPFSSDQPTNSEFWKNVLSSTLSDSQATHLDQYRQEQDKKKRLAMIELCVSTMKLELGLNDDQQERLSSLVTPLLEKAEIQCPSFYEPFLIYYHASKVDEGSLREFLSNAQLQKWKLFMAPSKQIGQMVEMEAQGAVRAVEVNGEPIEIDEDQ